LESTFFFWITKVSLRTVYFPFDRYFVVFRDVRHSTTVPCLRSLIMMAGCTSLVIFSDVRYPTTVPCLRSLILWLRDIFGKILLAVYLTYFSLSFSSKILKFQNLFIGETNKKTFISFTETWTLKINFIFLCWPSM